MTINRALKALAPFILVVVIHLTLTRCGSNGPPAPANNCSAGQYSTDGVTCLPCQAGTYSSSSGSTSCSNCSPGSYVDTAGASSCLSCPANNFQSNSGAISCVPCPQGTTSPAGSTSCN